MYYCVCLAVTHKEIEELAKIMKITKEEAKERLKVGSSCGICEECDEI